MNTAAIKQGSISVVRAPLLGCLTVPKGPGLVAGAFKLPGGARRTGESRNLLRRKVWPDLDFLGVVYMLHTMDNRLRR